MPEPVRDNIHELFTAFADGELDAPGTRALLEYLSAHPDALTTLEQQQRLGSAARRLIRGRTPAVPDSLRQRIEAMAVSPPAGGIGRNPARPRFRAVAAWWLAAAAALLVAGGLVGIWLAPRISRPAQAHLAVAPPPVSASLVRAVMVVHVDCSRFLDHFDGDKMPHELRELPQPLGDLLGTAPVPCPDFSRIGYEFVGAGPCRRPLEQTVHLLYRARGGKLDDTLSLFAQPDHGQAQVAEGVLFAAADAASPHPMLVWRRDGMVFYLVADNIGPLEEAVRLIDSAPRRQDSGEPQ